jgi:hypothetical protein
MSKDSPDCPYCGERMILHRFSEGSVFCVAWECCRCWSRGPRGIIGWEESPRDTIERITEALNKRDPKT